MPGRHDYSDQPRDQFGKAQILYPTPNVEDVIIVENVPIRTAEYKKAPYGQAHPEVSTAKLVSQKVSIGNDDKRIARRVYATERDDQDLYNFATTYSAESNAHQIVARSYILPRAGYEPLDKWTPDPVFDDALLVKEQQTTLESDDPDLHSLFIRVNRLYEVLPGPELMTRSIGAINLIPEKYRRLVRTTETNQPVRADYTFPTGLTGDETQIELVQETIARARLKIIEEVIDTDEGALVGGESGEFGPMVINENVVVDGTEIDTGYLIRKSTVTPLGNGKSIKITVRYPDDLADLELVDKKIGQESLIPAKYRRLVTNQVTRKIVDSTFVFPSALSGDESEIELQQETIDQARLKVTEEVINTDESDLVGSKTDEFGLLQILESVVADGTPADTGELIQESTVTPLGNGKSIKITLKYPDDLFDLQKVSKSIGQDSLIPEKYRRLVKHVETEKPVPVDYTFPTGLTGDEAKIEFIQKTITQARLRTLEEVIDTDESALVGAATDLYGTLTINEEIVVDGTPALEGFYVKDSKVTPLGNGKSIRITVNYDSFATLKRVEIDPETNIKLTIERSIVDPDTDGGVVGNVITEIKEIDKWRSLKIVTTVDTSSLPDPVTLNVTENWSFPDTLIGLTILPTKGYGRGEGGGSWSWDGEVSVQVINGYRGPCDGTLERSYFIGPPSYKPEITPILPSTGTVIINGGSLSDIGADDTVNTTARPRAITIPNVLTRGIKETKTLATFRFPPRPGFIEFLNARAGFEIEGFGGTYDIDIPASTPTQLNNGQEFIAKVDVKKYRGAGNVYILEVLKLKAVVGANYLAPPPVYNFVR